MPSFDLTVIAILAGLLAAVLYRLYAARFTPAEMTPAVHEPELQSPAYSLWLAPAASSASAAVLAALNASLPGPTFPSHATLLGSAPKGASLAHVVQGVRRALDGWREGLERKEGAGLEVPFEDVRIGDEFFRCVLVKLVDDPALHALHDDVLRHLPSPSERPTYLPHVSLVYSHMSTDERKQVVADLYASNRVRNIDGHSARVELRADGAESEGVRLAVFDRVVVVVTKDVAPEQWKPVAEIVI